MRIPPTHLVVSIGPSIGTYMDRDIPAWFISGDGVKHEYVGLLGDRQFDELSADESVIAPGLVYRKTS